MIAVVVTSPDGNLVRANEAFRKLLGFTPRDLLEKNLARELLAHSSDWEHWKSAGPEGRDVEIAFVGENRREVLLRGHVEHLAMQEGRGPWLRGVFADPTIGKEPPASSRRTAGSEPVAPIATVCHDLNNLLTVVMASIQIVARLVPDKPDVHEQLQRAISAAKRCGDLSHRLMSFANGPDAAIGAGAASDDLESGGRGHAEPSSDDRRARRRGAPAGPRG
ncbi:MAG TPA: PAS domain-containing protein [Gammaproteobacteria bacterium]|nr:PAS domain-containing protein [Gammaproteobacteria bacterium]